MPAGQPTTGSTNQARPQVEALNRDLSLEITQLQHTVQALRDQLERQASEANQTLLQRESDWRRNQQQLQDTIHALRAELEAAAAAHRAELQRRDASSASQLQELRDALVAQREMLDALHDGGHR